MRPQAADGVPRMVGAAPQEGTRALGNFPGSKVPVFGPRQKTMAGLDSGSRVEEHLGNGEMSGDRMAPARSSELVETLTWACFVSTCRSEA